MRKSQHGLGWLGSLIALAIAGGAGYYAYLVFTESDPTPSCAAAHTTCLQGCRRSATEAAEAQHCQEACQREAEVCASLER